VFGIIWRVMPDLLVATDRLGEELVLRGLDAAWTSLVLASSGKIKSASTKTAAPERVAAVVARERERERERNCARRPIDPRDVDSEPSPE
jgi:hypothetical protein